jgi:hypothetical protein
VQPGEADLTLELDAGRPQRPHPGIGRVGHRRLEERRLADPGVTDQHQRPAAPAGADEASPDLVGADQERMNRRQFGVPPDQRIGP